LPKTRLFLALVPDNSIIVMLDSVQSELKEKLSGCNVRWENPLKFHMTLRFLGDVDDDKIELIINVLDRIKFGFEELRFRTFEIGFFPNKRFPNVVYAGFSERGKNSDVLIDSIDSTMLNFGILPDKRFVPHITVGRFNKKKRTKPGKIDVPNLPVAETSLSGFSLMKSTLQQGGSEYTEIYKFNFQK